MKYEYEIKDFKLAEKYIDAVFTMDRLYKSQPGLLGKTILNEGIVNIDLDKLGENYTDLESWEKSKEALNFVYDEYETINNKYRKFYMKDQVRSLINLGEWAFEGKQENFEQLVSKLLCIDPKPASKNEIQKDQERLEKLLGDKGFSGSLEMRLAAWREENIVLKEDLKNTLETIIRDLKARTLALGFFEIQNENMDCIVETNVPYQACCDIDNNRVLINGDLEFTYYDLKHLMAHELFPGHLTQLARRRRLVTNGIVPADAGLVITNTASSVIFEGIADNGLAFIEYRDGIDDEINFVYQNLKGKAALTGGYMIHEEGRSIDEVKLFLKESLFATDSWINSRISLMTCAFRKPFIYTYWRGNEVVDKAYKYISKEQKSEFINYIYNHMQSVNSLNLFV